MLWNIEKTEIIVKIYPLPEQNTDILEKNSESICLELFFKNVPFSWIEKRLFLPWQLLMMAYKNFNYCSWKPKSMPNRRPKKENEFFQSRLVFLSNRWKFKLVSDIIFLNSFKNSQNHQIFINTDIDSIKKQCISINSGAKFKFALTQWEMNCKYGVFLMNFQKNERLRDLSALIESITLHFAVA